MAGMKRFVTYIYSYENKLKGGNAGFARFEIRGEECRIEIHLRGIGGRTVCKIYFFLLENGEMTGFEIGEIGIMNGSGDYRAVIPAGRICGSSFGIFDMKGIVFFSEDDRMFLSRWTEGKSFVAAKENFHIWKPRETRTNAVSIEDEKQKETMEAGEPAQEDLKQQISPAVEQVTVEPQSPPAEQVAVEPQSPPVEQVTVEPQSPAAEQRAKENDPIENVTATELPMQNVFPQYTWQEIWENLQAGHPVYKPFENDKIQCIRIELKDLRELPKRYWYLGNNSFLLHGFFNYHYLILGRHQDHYFVGVPGIFQRQEHVMAAVFGFPEFKAVAREKKEGRHQAEFAEEKTEPVNRFGFWSRYME